MHRFDGRAFDEIRKIKITENISLNADGSVFFEMGNTKVICTVVLQDGVPHFLKGKGQGWLTAEYALLPASTDVRVQRDSVTLKRNNRSAEISRLIGRSLRQVIYFSLIKDKTIYIDCDVVQADGSTRVAAINGAFYALLLACKKWINKKILLKSCIKEKIVAVSVGYLNGNVLLDLDYKEDSSIDADFNFVLTHDNNIIEIQGALEKGNLTWDSVCDMKNMALNGAAQVISSCNYE